MDALKDKKPETHAQRLERHKRDVVRERKARQARIEDSAAAEEADRRTRAEERGLKHVADEPLRQATLDAFIDKCVVRDPERSCTVERFFKAYRRFLGWSDIALWADNVYETVQAFETALEAKLGVRKAPSNCERNRDTPNWHALPGDFSPIFQGVGCIQMRDYDAEEQHRKHERLSAPINLGGWDWGRRDEDAHEEVARPVLH